MNKAEQVEARVKTPGGNSAPERGLSLRERGEIEISVATAKEYPRVVSQCKEEMYAMACSDEKVAAACMYAVPRAGTTVVGKSIRLAEIAVMAWGNIAAQSEVTYETDKWVYATGMCRDLEKNVMVSITARRRIVDKNGRRFSDDMIAVTGMAAVAVAYRNSVFKVIPGVLTDDVFAQCKVVAIGEAETFNKRKSDVLTKLGKMGADEARVLGSLGRRAVSDISQEDLLNLIALGTAIHSGDTDIDVAFPEAKTDKPASVVSAKQPEKVATVMTNKKEVKTPLKPKGQEKKTEPTAGEKQKAAKVKEQADQLRAEMEQEAEAAKEADVEPAVPETVNVEKEVDVSHMACENAGDRTKPCLERDGFLATDGEGCCITCGCKQEDIEAAAQGQSEEASQEQTDLLPE